MNRFQAILTEMRKLPWIHWIATFKQNEDLGRRAKEANPEWQEYSKTSVRLSWVALAYLFPGVFALYGVILGLTWWGGNKSFAIDALISRLLN